jgi:hypothetical protein
MQHLREVLGDTPRVVLVNVRIARSWEGEVNHELSQYVKHWPQAVIADWYDNSTQEELTDGVHPSVAARSIYARAIYDALETSETKSTGAAQNTTTTTGTTTTKSTATTTKKG